MRKTLSLILAVILLFGLIFEVSADSPSSWAKNEVEAGISEGLVPSELQKNYTSPVTRGQVAQMFVNLLEKATGRPIDSIMSEKKVTINQNAFTDTNDKAVLAANALGIINGTGNGKFSPNGTLKRAQIAAIINRVAKVMGIGTEGYTHEFTDITDNYKWADSELGWPVHAGIINGVGNGRFNPGGDLTTEQAILITYRALGALKDANITGAQNGNGEDTGSGILNNLPSEIPESGFTELNGNVPNFTQGQITTEEFEFYSGLDALGRCGPAFANISEFTLPTGSRQDISGIRPSGWQSTLYDGNLVEGGSLYNRCHLISYSLAAENDNALNLITGTRYMNTTMQRFENEVLYYVQSTGNHVLYRCVPVFAGEELIARGVTIEAYSVEDDGKGVQFYVFCYNVQPGVIIDYSNGDNQLDENSEIVKALILSGASDTSGPRSGSESETVTYILNKNTMVFHKPGCSSVTRMKESNKIYFTGTRDEAIEEGYRPCKNCDP